MAQADSTSDCLNNTTLDCNYTDSLIPSPEILDYAEIALLSIMVLIGGPMNLISFLKSLGYWTSLQFTATSSPKHNHKRQKARYGTPRKRTPPSRSIILKLHLTAANLFIILVYGLSQISWLATYSWRGGDLLCRVIKFFDTFTFYATSNIIVLIAIERVSVAAFIDQPRIVAICKKRLRYAAWVPWILATLFSVPQTYIWHVFAPYPTLFPNWQQCVTVWMAWKVTVDPLSEEYAMISFQEMLYSGIHLTLVFWLPALIVVSSYAVILIRFHQHIRKSTKDARRALVASNAAQFRKRVAGFHRSTTGTSPIPSSTSCQYGFEKESSSIMETFITLPTQPQRLHGTPDSDQPRSAAFLMEVPIVVNSSRMFIVQPTYTNVAVQTLTRAKRRTIRTTAWILFVYIACWAPYNMLELWRYLDPTVENRYLELLSNLIVLNAVVNPLIYKT